MAKKHINSSSGAILGQGIKYKAKPKIWKESQVSRDLRLNRERVFYKLFPEQRQAILEYVELMKNEWNKQDAK